jgi:hypothetical protein
MKKTFYGQFVAGETDRELLHTAERFFTCGIRSMPQVTIEDELSDEEVLASEFRYSRLVVCFAWDLIYSLGSIQRSIWITVFSCWKNVLELEVMDVFILLAV